MSNQPKPFEIKQSNGDKWSVNMEGNWVDVQTEEEAEVLRQYPILIKKLRDDIFGESDKNLAYKFIGICQNNNIECLDIRELRSRYEKYCENN